jgi:cytoskeletal protein CcmA (bactofilin family)
MANQNDGLSIPLTTSAAKPKEPRASEPVTPRVTAEPARFSEERAHSAEKGAGSRGNEVDRRTLIVGNGIFFSGELTCCDRLIVEGAIEARLQKCQNVIIGETGVFNGFASTENADVRGRFEGELVVRKRLLIRAGGQVSGTITYGEIEIESGGQISGSIETAEKVTAAPPLFSMSA